MGKHTFFSGHPILSQIINLIPKQVVDRAAQSHEADRYYKKFKTWDHLVTLLFGSFSHSNSIREMITGLQASQNQLSHFKLAHTPRRSTFADANSKRPAAVFAQIYQKLADRLLPDSPDSRGDNKPLYIVDSTTISLFSDIMKNAGRPGADGRRKGGAKAHSVIREDHLCIEFMHITEASKHDSPFLKDVPLPNGSYVCFDRGYNNYSLFKEWTCDSGSKTINYVTRLRENAHILSQTEREVDDEQRKAGIEADKKVVLGHPGNTNTQALAGRIVYFRDPETGQLYKYLTNIEHLKASQIADIYRRRWQIELVFKRIKQAYPLRYFYGESVNAICIQIWAVMICDLLVQCIMRGRQKKWSYSNLRAMIRIHLLSYVNLTKFLESPEKAIVSAARERSAEINLFTVPGG
jgi:hypothetical protein